MTDKPMPTDKLSVAQKSMLTDPRLMEILSEPAAGEKSSPPRGGSDPVPSHEHAVLKWGRHLQAKKKWREQNKQYLREYHRAWKERNQERVKAYRAISKKGESPGTLMGLLASQQSRCKLCGGDLTRERHLDHVVPKSKGGVSGLENYQYLCPPCNTAKGVFTNEEFLEHIKLILLYNGKWYE